MARIPRRGAIYYIQQAIPRDLHSAWGAKQEWRSLHTPDCETAKGRHLEAKLAYRRRFAEMRAAKAAKAQQTAAPKATLEPEVDWEGLEVMERHWQEVDARKETDPVFAAQVRQEAMIREDINDRQLRRDIKSEAAQQRAKPVGTPLQTVVGLWAETQTDPKTIARMKAVVSGFEDYFGKLTIEAITTDDMWAYTDKLLKATTPANARVKFRVFNTLLRFARPRIIKHNPADGIRIPVKSAPETKRLGLDLAALNAIFSSAVFVSGERPEGGCGEAAYWLPLLALYTGARLNELGQLRRTDIVRETYIDASNGDVDATAWVIRITANAAEGLKIKNAGSARRVPIHEELISRGFLDYVARANGQGRIFPLLTPDVYGHLTTSWSKWYARYLRGPIGIADKRIVFHSYRHAFRQYALQVRVPDVDVMALMGHTGPEVKAAYNGVEPPLSRLVDAIQQYRVPGFTLPPAPPKLSVTE